MTFLDFFTNVLAPMFPGAEILEERWEPQNRVSSLVTFASGATRLRVRENANEPAFLQLSRAQPFEGEEKDFVEILVRTFAAAKAEAGEFLPQLQEIIIREAIAKSVAPGRSTQQQTVAKVLGIYSNWATQTYEGQRVSCGSLITTSHLVSESERLKTESLLAEEFAKALTDGVDTWWRIAAVGGVISFESSDAATKLSAPADGFFPERYRPIALRTGGNAVAIALNRNGEILVFAGQVLRFAMRRGAWFNFAHDSVVKQMSPGGAGSAKLRKAVYASCLDVSFSRTGGCIGLLRTRDLAAFRERRIVADTDRIGNSANPKAQAAATLVAGREFSELPRSIRKELLALDGAVVLEPNGHVYTAGAILKLANVNLGTHGGRSAAAKTLQNYGLGIKISEDGMISGYKKEFGDARTAFKVG